MKFVLPVFHLSGLREHDEKLADPWVATLGHSLPEKFFFEKLFFCRDSFRRGELREGGGGREGKSLRNGWLCTAPKADRLSIDR